MRAAKKSTEEIVFLIASAFLRQRYPLSELGMELKEEVQALFATGKIPTKYIDILPTVENSRLELFADFNLSPEEEREIFGWGLSTIQSHEGCTRQCKQCYKNAGNRLLMMPFAAAAKIAQKKREYEEKAFEEWILWARHLRDNSIIDVRGLRPWKFLKDLRRKELEILAGTVLGEWRSFPSQIVKLRPFPHDLPLSVQRREFARCVPISLGHLLVYGVFNYDGNEPSEYRDGRFLHLNGTPADYGDIFQLMSTPIRPISITTAGWFDDDPMATTSMRKVIDWCLVHPKLNRRSTFRISVSLYERHAEADLMGYCDQIERMIIEAAPLFPLVNLYYDKGDDEHYRIVMMLGILFKDLMEDKLGIPGDVLFTPISYQYGRAVNLRHGEDYETWDPDQNIDGICICPNGEVKRKPDSEWARRKDKKGRTHHFLKAIEGSQPEPTGMWLYHLLD